MIRWPEFSTGIAGRLLRWLMLAGLASVGHAQTGQSLTLQLTDTSNGSAYQYHLYVPQSVLQADQDLAPLLLVYHGTAGPGNAHQSAIATRNFWRDIADRNGFAVAAQIGTGSQGGWIPAVAERRMHQIIDDVISRYPVDEGRLLAWGFSSGGHILHDFMLRRGQRFRAYAVRAGAVDAYAGNSVFAQAHRTIPVHISVGVDDPLASFALADYSRFLNAGWSEGQDLVYRTGNGGHTYTEQDLADSWSFLHTHIAAVHQPHVYSGLWYVPVQSGQGLIIEVLAPQSGVGESRINAYWYHFLDGEPVWMTGLGTLRENQANIPLLITSSAGFPPQFDSDDVNLEEWGELVLRFSDERNAHLYWDAEDPRFASGYLSLEQLGFVDQGPVGCLSGSYYQPTESGHGFTLTLLQGIEHPVAFITWFVYVDGVQTWLVSQAEIIDNRITDAPVFIYSGGQFGDQFDQASLQQSDWGSLSLSIRDDGSVDVEWQSDMPGFSSGSLRLLRLTGIAGVQCQM